MRDSWENRFEWIQTVLQWTALVFGVGLSILELGVDTGTVFASIGVTAYTIGMQAIPYRHKQIPLIAGLLAFLGVATALFAIALTGGLDSAYLLYLTVPIFFASAFHGIVIGGPTTIAAVLGLIAVAGASGSDLLSPPLPALIAFYTLIGITFGQAHRILIDEPRLGSDGAQYGRLETAHRLLTELAGLAGSAELNPVTIGRAALRDLAAAVPHSASVIAIFDQGEQLVVATRGQPDPDASSVDYGISLHGDDIGLLRIWPLPGASADDHADAIDRSMRMVGLAFDNVLLLQSIAHRAVQEERIRLARDLHDNIGPSLVSIGLGLDLLLQEPGVDAASKESVAEMRATTSELVEQVRTTVTNFRAAESASLVEHAEIIAADVPASGPSIVISIDETRRPGRVVATQVAAIMAESVRNAVEHSGATVVTIEGESGDDYGWIRIGDNGRGFDRQTPLGRHYGLIGIQERADDIGAHLQIDSTLQKGTTVEVRWKRP